MKKVVQNWRETQAIKIKKGDLVYLPDIREWHPVGAISVVNGEVRVWFGLSSHSMILSRSTYKVAIR